MPGLLFLMQKLHERYPDITSIKTSSALELKSFAGKGGVDEVYFINKEGLVFNSSKAEHIAEDGDTLRVYKGPGAGNSKYSNY